MNLKLRYAVFLFLAFAAKNNFAQAPSISYSSPQVYTVGSAISPLSPVNTGGAVPAQTLVTIGSGFNNLKGVTFDALGNVYVAEDGNNAVSEIPAGGGTVLTLGSGFSSPTGVAVDAAGNIYVADNGNNAVKKIPFGGGAVVVVATGFNGPYGIALDAKGNIYVGDSNNNAVEKIPAGSNTPVSIGTGFNHPTGVAVDTAGNVYVADRGNNLIKKILASNGSTVTLSTGNGNPNGVAVDGAGNVYYADTNNTSIIELPIGGGNTVTIGSGFSIPSAVAIDSKRNIYVGDNGNGNGDIKEVSIGGYTINEALPVGLSFSNTTGVISGTPTVVNPSTKYTVIATNGNGSSTATINITVNPPAKPNISYSTPQVYTMNIQISPLSPVNKGGAVAASGGYSISPALPIGLSFDTNAGTISGTPTIASPATNYKVTATNPGGSGTANINITVNPPAKPNISYSTPQVYTVSTAISPLSPSNTGGSVAARSITALTSGLNNPNGVAFDTAGNIYVAENGNNDVKKIPVGGGTPVIIGSGFRNPTGVAVDSTGNVYVADCNNNEVKEIPVGGGPIIVLGSGFNSPYGIALDAANNIYVSDFYNNAIKKIPAGNGTPPVTIATGFNGPTGVAVDASGNIYVADQYDNAIKKITAGSGAVTSIATGFGNPDGVAVDALGNVFFSDKNASWIYGVASGSSMAVAIGSGFTAPAGVAVNKSETLFIADNGAVKQINAGGYFISPALPAGLSFDLNAGTVSGSPAAVSPATNYTVTAVNAGGSGTAVINITVNPYPAPVLSYSTPHAYPANVAINPLAPSSSGVGVGGSVGITTLASGFNLLRGIAVDAAGNVYVAEDGNNAVREIPVGGGASLTLGSGFSSPTGVAVDPAGNIYVADNGNNAIKKIPAGGGAIVVVATGFNGPYGIALDAAGNIYVGDSNNNEVKKIPAGSNVPVTMGTGFNHPTGVAVDAAGNVYVADRANNAIKKILAIGGSTITMTSGSGNPNGVAVDPGGNVYYADTENSWLVELPVGGGSTINVGSGFNMPTSAAINTTGIIYLGDDGNTAIKKITSTGGYFISSALPAGLSLNTNTGVISGTPTAVSPATNYTVTAFNIGGSTSATVNISVFSPGATLSNLAISSGTLLPAFAPATTAYTASVPFASSSIIVSPTTADPAATVTVNGTAVVSGSASAPITLNQGLNTITTVVTAQDGTTTKTYTIKITRAAPSTNALIASISLSPVSTLVSSTGPGYLNFTSAVGGSESSVQVIPTTKDATATITVNGIAVISGTPSQPIALNAGANTITTVITAQDGVTTKTIIITVNKLPSTNAGLANIALSSGSLTPAFATATNSYTASVSSATASITLTPTASDATATIKVNGTVVANGSASASIPLAVGANTITTIVTAQDGKTTKTYTVVVTRLSNNAGLANLVIGNGTLLPAFATATTVYSASVPFATTSVTITPTTADATATVTVNGTATASGTASGAIALNQGLNTITTIVTAQDGTTTKTYTIKITRAAPSTNALIASISLSPVSTLVSSTGPGYLNFTAAAGGNESSVQVIATTKDATATIMVNGIAAISGTPSQPIDLNVGANTITTVITAQDGITTKTIIITVNKLPSTNAGLANITLSDGTLTPAFATATTSYTAAVSNATASVTVTPATNDGSATVKINGITVPNGSASPYIPLTVGANTITLVVTAQDGKTTKTYTVTVTRAPSANASLANLAISSGTLAPVFTTLTTSYTASVSNATTSVTVTPTTADATATLTVNGTTVASGTASAAIPLTVGPNTITTLVTAQDGTTTQTYTVTIIRAPSAIATLSNLATSGGTLAPVFATATTSYTATVPFAIASITVTPTTTDQTATVTVNGIATTPGSASGTIALNQGLNTITTIVTAQDGTTTKTYTIKITRAAPSTNALIASISLTPVSTLVSSAGPGYLNFTAAAANTEASVQVIATAKDPTATITVNGTDATSGTASQLIALNVGANTITTVITAQDGVTTKTVIITVNRAAPKPANSLYDLISVTKPTDNVTLEDGITVHQAVSPNGDGINDFLTIEGITSHPENQLMILDRNGVMVYQAKGYDNSSKLFDGHSTLNGKMQLPGTYFYSLDYTVNGENKHKTGYIILKY